MTISRMAALRPYIAVFYRRGGNGKNFGFGSASGGVRVLYQHILAGG